jgi:hypothetical protein
MTLAIILAGMSLLVSGTTFILILVLLGRSEFQYPSVEDMEDIELELDELRANQSKLWRYLEAVDDEVGANGHHVLGVWVPGEKAPA